MVEIFLLGNLVVLWFLLRPLRDWYVIEHQVVYGKDLRSSDMGFSALHLQAHDLTIKSKRENTATLVHKGGGHLLIEQNVFADLQAALLHFDHLKEVNKFGNEDDGRSTVFLRRVVARSRRGAVMLPPQTYPFAREAEVLKRFSSTYLAPERQGTEEPGQTVNSDGEDTGLEPSNK